MTTLDRIVLYINASYISSMCSRLTRLAGTQDEPVSDSRRESASGAVGKQPAMDGLLANLGSVVALLLDITIAIARVPVLFGLLIVGN